jgi:hypothetical protein
MVSKLARHLLKPARGGAASVIVVFALLATVAVHARIVGIPLALLLISWFFKYAYILFDHTMRGFEEPPVLDIQMVNPVNEQRPLAQTIISAGCAFGIYSVYNKWGTTPAAILSIIFLILLPASIAVLGVEGSIVRAANPILWVRMAIGLGHVYFGVFILLIAEFFVLFWLQRFDWPLMISFAIAMFGLLSVFSVLGGAVYERRDQLGIIAWQSPEKDEELQRKEDHKRDEAIVTEAYGLLRANAHVKSWEKLQNWLKTQDFSLEAYEWLLQRVSEWNDPRYTTRLSEDLIERLVARGKAGDALKFLGKKLLTDAGFRPKSASDTLALAQYAARGGGSRRTALLILSNFAERFPADPRAPVAAELSRQLQG